jgi:hypothetical protein
VERSPESGDVLVAAPTGGRTPATPPLIGGHVESASEGVGVLGALREIDIGNRVVVTDAFGVQHGYRVAARRLYPKYSLPGTFFRSPDGLGSS